MSEPKTRTFYVVSSGRDEYPGDGLRISTEPGHRGEELDKHFLEKLGLEVKEGDEIEISARVVTRVVTERRPV